MRILITGASGLLGINLALEYAEEHEVVGTVNRQRMNLNFLPDSKRFVCIQTNLLEKGSLEFLLKQSEPDWVIHCAAMANLEDCEDDPLLAMRVNAELPGQLAQWVRQAGARLIYISTDAVFDGKRGNYTEMDTPHPLSAYAKSKLAGEIAVLEADPTAFVARVNIFGWSISGNRSLAEFFYNHLKAAEPVKGFTDVFVCPLLVNDIAGLMLKAMNLRLSGVYHVVSRDSISKYEFGVHLAKTFGFDEALIEPVPLQAAGLRAARSPFLILDATKFSTSIGQELPGVDIGLDHFFRLYRKNYPDQLQKIGAVNGN